MSHLSTVLLGAAVAGAVTIGAGSLPVPSASPERPGRVSTAGSQHPTTPATFTSPVPTATVVLRGFEPPATRWSPGHRGVDLAAGAGAEVVAPADGVVAFAGTVVDRGVVTVTHPDGLRSSVEPVTPNVVVGQEVRRGDAIGTVDPGHCGPVPCVHWGVRRGADYLDPLGLLASRRTVVLLPLSSTRP